MNKYYILIIMSLLCAGGILRAQTGFTGNLPLPEAIALKGEAKYYLPETLFDFMNGGAENYLAYGFQQLEVAELGGTDGTSFQLEVYTMQSIDHAFGIYSAEYNPAVTPVAVGTRGYQIEQVIVFFADRYYVKLSTTQATPEAAESLMNLALATDSLLGGERRFPFIFECYYDRDDAFFQYINKSYLGYEFLNRAFVVKGMNSSQPDFFVLAHDTPELALAALKTWMKANKAKGKPVEGNLMIFNDKYQGSVRVKWKGKYLVGSLPPGGEESDSQITRVTDCLVH